MTWATVSARGAQRWASGHPWIYRSDVADHPDAPGIVSVRDARGKFLGQALCSPRSEIRLRLLEQDRADNRSCMVDHAAPRLPRETPSASTPTRGAAVHARRRWDCRSALIVDRYDRWLVVQLLSAALETQREQIVSAPSGMCSKNPDGILFRHDAAGAPVPPGAQRGRRTRVGECSPTDRSPRRERPLARGTMAGTENRRLSRSAREPADRGHPRPGRRDGTRLLRLSRLLRAAPRGTRKEGGHRTQM